MKIDAEIVLSASVGKAFQRVSSVFAEPRSKARFLYCGN